MILSARAILIALTALCAGVAQAKEKSVYMFMQDAKLNLAQLPDDVDLDPQNEKGQMTIPSGTSFEVLDSVEIPGSGQFVYLRTNGTAKFWVTLDELESVAYIKPYSQYAAYGSSGYGNGSIRDQARRIISRLGCHPGVDIRMRSGTAVTARGSGRITMAGVGRGWGNYVRISHGGAYTGYAHLSRISVRVGQQVSAGTVLGYSGCTGLCTGPHLHFEDTRPGSPSRACILRRDGGRR